MPYLFCTATRGLTTYDRPFHGRADSLIPGPPDPAETDDALDLSGEDAIDTHDLAGPRHGAQQVPGFNPDHTGLVVVSRSGTTTDVDGADVDLVWGPADVLGSWR